MEVESGSHFAHGVSGRKEAADSMSRAAYLFLFFQFAILLLFSGFGLTYANEQVTLNFNVGYDMFSGVLIMMFIGFGYLMTFMDTYGMGALGFTMAITVLVFEWSIVTEEIASNIFAGNDSLPSNGFNVGIYDCLNSLFAVAAILISFGGVIGKLSLFQLLVMSIIETLFYSLNNHFLLTKYHVVDAGGTIIIHMFGAYFGLAVAWMIGPTSSEQKGSIYADQFALIGTLFLWIYWPSFVGGALPAGSDAQQQAIINTILALSGSTVAAFSLSILLDENRKLGPVDIQNATLAGGVTIGCLASLSLSPAQAVLFGFLAGAISTYGYHHIMPSLLDKMSLHDSCGIHNLHGMPSVFGGLLSVYMAYTTPCSQYQAAYAATQWQGQLQGVLMTLFVSIFTGIGTGWMLNKLESKKYASPFHDGLYWKLASSAPSRNNSQTLLNQLS